MTGTASTRYVTTETRSPRFGSIDRGQQDAVQNVIVPNAVWLFGCLAVNPAVEGPRQCTRR